MTAAGEAWQAAMDIRDRQVDMLKADYPAWRLVADGHGLYAIGPGGVIGPHAPSAPRSVLDDLRWQDAHRAIRSRR